MSDEKKSEGTELGLKIVMIIAVVIFVIWVLWNVVVSMIPTVGGSFGAGFPGGSGGRAVRDVEIDVEPQVVYRIDDHHFFTLEKYKDCSSGGLVYYNDTNKKIKIFAGPKGGDKEPQDEVSMSQVNDTLAFKGKFIFAANDNIIAYPTRDVNYKYRNSTFFIRYTDFNNPSNTTSSGGIFIDAIATVTNDAIFIQDSTISKYSKKIKIPQNNLDDYELVSPSDINYPLKSKDDHFHCENTIKPRRVKYISD
ncbi:MULTISPECIES: hypothetical protein [Rahnella]|uniref:Tli3-like domain-containing protein n=1 Tax=Rahnella laticis TaxID=2787622 RepID=A0ABS0E001_9GAMM|nr:MULTISPECIES: hypothetical protein [Rahnella]MBF7978400.1 hypothetical protein [Rahnella laticis]MBF7997883.1 hypothetical protein [Rahnella sp. LAC-M12]